MTTANNKIDMGSFWAYVYHWILVMRRSRIITREMAKREMQLCEEYLGEGRTIDDLQEWIELTTYDELREMAESRLQGES